MKFFKRIAVVELVFVFLVCFLFPVNISRAAEADFAQPIQLFDLPAGARAPGMGGAFTAIADDASAPLWNPAGLSQSRKRSFSLMQSKQSITQSSDDIKYDFLSLAYPLSSRSTFAVTYLNNGIGGLENWQVTDYDPDEPPAGDPCFAAAPPNDCATKYGDLNPGVEDTGTNNADPFDDKVDLIGVFDNKESAIVLSYGQEVRENLSLGVNLKFYNHNIGPFLDPVSLNVRKPTFTSFSAKANGIGIDLGVLYQFSKPPKGLDALSFGLLVQDINSTKVKWNTGSTESQVMNWRAGIAAKLLREKLTIALDYDKRTEKKLRAGAEYWVNPMIGLRIGSDDGVFTVGTSIRITSESIKNFQVDYAYKKFDESKTIIKNSNLIAVTVGF